jgi:acetyl esterase/lipase
MMRRIFLLLAVILASLTAAGHGRAEGGPAVQMTTITYVTGPGADPVKHRLDLFRPAGGADLPVLVFLHGGVWQRGDKDDYRHIGEVFARRGILTAVASYRLAPAARHPAQAQDAARAVAWIIHHAGEYGARADRVYLSGHSAGGHLVSLLLFDPQYLRAEGVDPEQLAGIIALSGVFDLTKPMDDTAEGGLDRYVYPVFGSDRQTLEAASPVNHLHPTRARLLVILAGEDYQAMRRQSEMYVDALRKHGIPVTFETMKGHGHFELVQAIGHAEDPTTEAITRFVR